MSIEIKTRHFWRGVFAELIATTLFVFISCGATLPMQGASVTIQQQSWAIGLAMATVVQCVGFASGGHVNPAVTGAFVFTGKITWLRALFYIAAQTAGGIGGAAMLYALTPYNLRGNLGVPIIQDDITVGQAVGIEAVLSFIIVLTVFASTDCSRKCNDYGLAPLMIGLAYAASHFIGIAYTGCSVNPARSLGPAIIMNQYEDQWIFWTGPILAGIVAGLVYELLLRTSVDARAYQLSPRVCNINCCHVSDSDNVKQDVFSSGNSPTGRLSSLKYGKRHKEFDDILNFHNTSDSGGMYKI